MKSHEEIIKKINSYSKNKIPFLLLVDFEMKKPLLFLIDELIKENIFFSFPDFKNKVIPNKQIKHQSLFEKNNPINFEKYKVGFEKVMSHLYYGNSYLTNYTQKSKIETESSLLEIYNIAKSKYKIIFKDKWLCFSPETFIRIINNEIYAYPMKGTIDASLPKAAHQLMQNKKELAEHFTIVDLIRNDISMVANEVIVSKFRYIEKIKSNNKTLLQTSSTIKGILPTNYQNQLGEILFSLLPAGSISGAPKTKTLEIIKQAEIDKRGYYTGVAFYFDGNNVDSCVMIRFIEKIKNEYYYRSGGGITINSKIKEEFQELKDKIYVPIS